MKKALVVLSGGQDSTTCLFWAIKIYGNENVEAIGFDYNQKHKVELECADNICKKNNISFEIIKLPLLSELTVNSLTRDNILVDIDKPDNAPPNSFVDGRNMLFLTYAAIYAKNKGIKNIITGVCETDFSGYPDCRDIFIKSLNVTLNLSMDYPFVIETPLMWLDKAEVWQLADSLGVIDVISNDTITCYNGIKGGCSDCPACKLRQNGYTKYLSSRGNTYV